MKKFKVTARKVMYTEEVTRVIEAETDIDAEGIFEDMETEVFSGDIIDTEIEFTECTEEV